MTQHEPVDRDRLVDRVRHYARAAGATPSSISSMVDMLTSPLGTAILQLDTGSVLTSQLNNDLYKVAMQSMYAQYMTGVTADFALNIRKCPRLAPQHDAPITATSSSSSKSSALQAMAGSNTNCSDSSSNGSNGGSSSSVLSPGAYVLADIRQQYPHIFSELVSHTSQELQTLQPFNPEVMEALQELNSYTPPQALVDRLSAAGVAPVEWIDIEGVPVAVGSGPIEAASNTETSVMQAVQAVIIAAAAQQAGDTVCARAHTSSPASGIDSSGGSSGSIDTPSTPSATSTPAHTASSSSSSGSGSSGGSKQHCGMLYDRTERLASSLGRMVWTVQQLNVMDHGLKIMLMAGRRSTDLLHLMLQNLYFMQHVQGYIGTSSLLAAATLRRLMVQQGMDTLQRQKLCGRIMGTHAHEMTSMTHQLLAGFDAEAGRRCGLQAPVCISQLLAHILFITANGTPSNSSKGSSNSSSNSNDTPSSSSSSGFAHGTALPDTFTTPYFVGLATRLDIPPEFVEDMKSKWRVELEPSSKVFDLFSTWRLDSGDYVKMAQLIYDAWQARNKEQQGAGLPPLPPLTLLYSNISTLDDIQQLTQLPPHIRPAMVGFGGLADGFMPFDTPAHPDSSSSSSSSNTSAVHTASAPAEGVAVPGSTSAAAAASGQGSVTAAAAPAGPADVTKAGAVAPAAAAAEEEHIKAATAAHTQKPVTLPVASLVMKAVQARLPAHVTNSSTSTIMNDAADSHARATAAATGLADSLAALDLTPHTATAPTATAAAGTAAEAAAAAEVLLSVAQPSAVKLGDGSLSKAQLDPRLTAAQQHRVLEGLMQQLTQAQQLQWGLQGQQEQPEQQVLSGDHSLSSKWGRAADSQQSDRAASGVQQLSAANGGDGAQACSEGGRQGGSGVDVVRVLSGVLREAYVAVVREGVLMEAPAAQL